MERSAVNVGGYEYNERLECCKYGNQELFKQVSEQMRELVLYVCLSEHVGNC